MTKLTLAAGMAAGALALAAAGCGGGSSGGGYGGGGGTASTPAKGGASVGVANSNLGKILVDAQGRTLYLFEADKGPKSTCSGACASAWPPVTTKGAPVAVDGAAKAMLGTTKRADGTMEVTYGGHPLYTYAGDTSAGQATGQGLDQFGAEWYVLSPAGQKVEGGES
jgi:predicted lipoprotein with Yx(FWY)xxD motif